KSWEPASARLTPFGAAMYVLLRRCDEDGLDWEEGPDEDQDEDEEEAPSAFGRLQELMRPYFPEWENNLELPELDWREGTFVFRVSLGDVWRDIAIGDEDTLEDLVTCILSSVKFDFDHLYELQYRDVLGRAVTASHPE